MSPRQFARGAGASVLGRPTCRGATEAEARVQLSAQSPGPFRVSGWADARAPEFEDNYLGQSHLDLCGMCKVPPFGRRNVEVEGAASPAHPRTLRNRFARILRLCFVAPFAYSSIVRLLTILLSPVSLTLASILVRFSVLICFHVHTSPLYCFSPAVRQDGIAFAEGYPSKLD